VTALYLYDDATARAFEPFALTRPCGELRAGTTLVRERWERALGAPAAGFVAGEHLADFEEEGAPPYAADTIPAGAIVANARCVAALADTDRSAATWHCEGRLAAVRLARAVPVAVLADGSAALDALPAEQGPASRVAGRWLGELWDLIRDLSPQLLEDIPAVAATRSVAPPPAHAVVLGAHPVHVEQGATIEPFTVFDTSAGPVLVRRGATVSAFTRVVGPCYIGEESSVAGDKIANCSLGEVSRIHGEISTTIVLGHSNKAHDGFVGHSLLGRWVNLGAGTTTSNLKNTYGTVQLWTPGGVRDTGLQFFGTAFGDHVKTGIGLRLSTGTVLGAGANVYDGMPPKAVAPFAWGSGAPYDAYDAEKFVAVAAKAMARRHVTLGEKGRRQLLRAHAARWSAPGT
jgi:UDP-N-acetylglucosamine diphosphorylase/glucosamine-1-phosphate N-acetyltransferase